MKRIFFTFFVIVFTSIWSVGITAQQPTTRAKSTGKRNGKGSAKKTEAATEPQQPPASAEETAQTAPPLTDDEQLKAIIALSPVDRIEKLQAFIDTHSDSPLKSRASELMVSAHAAIADEMLRSGDSAGGTREFHLAISSAPPDMSDKLYYEVVAQIPLNLYLRGQRDASIEAARLVEALVREKPNRLLALGSFFLRVEEPDEAARLAGFVIKLNPDFALAHQTMGAALHMSFRFDDAITEFARAVELDPKSTTARSSLADLKRATGKPEEALSLYREQLQLTPENKSIRAGIVLALLDLGKKDEAETELKAALTADPANLPLLAGAAYWYAAHGDGLRAVELAQRAVDVEPRYTWSYFALARGLVLVHKPQNADGLPNYARRFGNFPTLDYELASALAASGLYNEAVTALSRSFSIKEEQLETRLANRVPASSADFTELLAPERKASIFQAAPADSESNSRMLKALLVFNQTLEKADKDPGTAAVKTTISAARQVIDGNDELRTFRQLYVAEKLLRQNMGLNTVIDIMQTAPDGVEAAIDAPASTMAILADEVREVRARALEVGGTANIPELPRNTRSTILRGRIEDNAGMAYYLAGKIPESVTHFRRAVSVLPETTIWGRTANWHLGDALRNNGNDTEALASYLKAYDPASPDPIKRAVIQTLYKRVNGSVDGLDEKIGPAVSYASRSVPKTEQAAPATDNIPLPPAPLLPAPPDVKPVTRETGVIGLPADSKPAAADTLPAAAAPNSSAADQPRPQASPNSEVPATDNLKPSPENNPATDASKDAPKSNPDETRPAAPDQPKSDAGEVKPAEQDQKKADPAETNPTTPDSPKTDNSEVKPSADNPKSEPSTPSPTEKPKPDTPEAPKTKEPETRKRRVTRPD
jgi:tetratricopeptide (TPR) repeat protein